MHTTGVTLVLRPLAGALALGLLRLAR